MSQLCHSHEHVSWAGNFGYSFSLQLSFSLTFQRNPGPWTPPDPYPPLQGHVILKINKITFHITDYYHFITTFTIISNSLLTSIDPIHYNFHFHGPFWFNFRFHNTFHFNIQLLLISFQLTIQISFLLHISFHFNFNSHYSLHFNIHSLSNLF